MKPHLLTSAPALPSPRLLLPFLLPSTSPAHFRLPSFSIRHCGSADDDVHPVLLHGSGEAQLGEVDGDDLHKTRPKGVRSGRKAAEEGTALLDVLACTLCPAEETRLSQYRFKSLFARRRPSKLCKSHLNQKRGSSPHANNLPERDLSTPSR